MGMWLNKKLSDRLITQLSENLDYVKKLHQQIDVLRIRETRLVKSLTEKTMENSQLREQLMSNSWQEALK